MWFVHNKKIRFLIRFIIGIVFIFSGFVKAIDPVGSKILLTEYFHALHIFWLDSLALFIGVFFSTVELLLGVMLLSKCAIRIAAWVQMIFMAFFTVVTLWLALFNPIQDCGCFGEFIKLSNWQTFFKNLILLPLSVALFGFRNIYTQMSKKWWVSVSFIFVSSLSIVILSVYCYRHLPMMDVMGFKVGNDIPTMLHEARNNPEHIYKTVFVYSKDGVRKRFTEDALPDSTWTFEDAITTEIPTGKHLRLTDFSVRDSEGMVVTDSLMSVKSASFAFVIQDVEVLEHYSLEPFKALVQQAHDRDIFMYVVTGSDYERTRNFMEDNAIAIPVFSTDYKTSITMVRSNPGLVYFNEGTVVYKWSSADMPTVEKWQDIVSKDEDIVISQEIIRQRLNIEIALLSLIILLILWPYIWLRKKPHLPNLQNLGDEAPNIEEH